MELREAVEKATVEVTDWALQVTASDDDVVKQFNLISYDSVVKSLVVDFCTKAGTKVADAVWGELNTPEAKADPDTAFSIMVEAATKKALESAFVFFAIGWVMGAPENSARPKNRNTFMSVMRATSPDELRLLEKRFAEEEFLRTRFIDQVNAAGMLVSRIFAEQKVGLTAESVAMWCSITSSLPTFEAYELATRSRMLIEEAVLLDLHATEFE